MRPLIYIELYKEPTFQYAKPNFDLLKKECGNTIIECDNFSDEVTLGLINKVLADETCILILHAIEEASELQLIGKTLRAAQKNNTPIFFVGDHPNFKALINRSNNAVHVPNMDELILHIKAV